MPFCMVFTGPLAPRVGRAFGWCVDILNIAAIGGVPWSKLAVSLACTASLSAMHFILSALGRVVSCTSLLLQNPGVLIFLSCECLAVPVYPVGLSKQLRSLCVFFAPGPAHGRLHQHQCRAGGGGSHRFDGTDGVATQLCRPGQLIRRCGQRPRRCLCGCRPGGERAGCFRATLAQVSWSSNGALRRLSHS